MDTDTARQLLATARRNLLATRETVARDGLLHPGEPGNVEAMDDTAEDATDLSELLTEAELDRSLVADIDGQLADVDAAEQRLEAGTFGRCETCGAQILEERLHAVPWARFCLPHQASFETSAGFS